MKKYILFLVFLLSSILSFGAHEISWEQPMTFSIIEVGTIKNFNETQGILKVTGDLGDIKLSIIPLGTQELLIDNSRNIFTLKNFDNNDSTIRFGLSKSLNGEFLPLSAFQITKENTPLYIFIRGELDLGFSSNFGSQRGNIRFLVE